MVEEKDAKIQWFQALLISHATWPMYWGSLKVRGLFLGSDVIAFSMEFLIVNV
jgi:hypothetical protein